MSDSKLPSAAAAAAPSPSPADQRVLLFDVNRELPRCGVSLVEPDPDVLDLAFCGVCRKEINYQVDLKSVRAAQPQLVDVEGAEAKAKAAAAAGASDPLDDVSLERVADSWGFPGLSQDERLLTEIHRDMRYGANARRGGMGLEEFLGVPGLLLCGHSFCRECLFQLVPVKHEDPRADSTCVVVGWAVVLYCDVLTLFSFSRLCVVRGLRVSLWSDADPGYSRRVLSAD